VKKSLHRPGEIRFNGHGVSMSRSSWFAVVAVAALALTTTAAATPLRV